MVANHLPESGAHVVVTCTTLESGIQGAALIQHSPLFPTMQQGDAPRRLQQAQVRARSKHSPDTERMIAETAAAQGVRAVWNALFPALEEGTHGMNLRRVTTG